MTEPAAATHNEAGALSALAYENCIFPMVEASDLRGGDLQICTEGRGVEVTDIEGRTFLDMVSGSARANSLGYGNTEVVRAIAEQLERLHHLGRAHPDDGADDSAWPPSSPNSRPAILASRFS